MRFLKFKEYNAKFIGLCKFYIPSLAPKRDSSIKAYFEEQDHVEAYVKFRSVLPSEIVRKLVAFMDESFLSAECNVVDVGCGSGQSTIPLGCAFKHVTGIDTSVAQITAANKTKLANVTYIVGTGENIPLPNGSIHLVAAINAVHWLDIDQFYAEADRVLISRGVLALIRGTPVTEIRGFEQETQKLFHQLKRDTRHYWDEAHQVGDYLYDNINIPYRESVRDKSVITVENVSVEYIVERIKTFSGIAKFLREKPDEAKIVLDEFTSNLMKIVGGGDRRPCEMKVELLRQFVLLMGRKP